MFSSNLRHNQTTSLLEQKSTATQLNPTTRYPQFWKKLGRNGGKPRRIDRPKESTHSSVCQELLREPLLHHPALAQAPVSLQPITPFSAVHVFGWSARHVKFPKRARVHVYVRVIDRSLNGVLRLRIRYTLKSPFIDCPHV